MEKVVPRRIVYLHEPIDDPQGNPGKAGRPCVIVRVEEPGSALVCGITGEIPRQPHPDFVNLNWGPHSRSKLSKPCAAMCPWLAVISVASIKDFGGLIGADEFHRITLRLMELQQAKNPPPDPDADSDGTE